MLTPYEAMNALFGYNVELDTKGAWTLSDAAVKHLTDVTNDQAPGGWSAFVALAAGTGYIKAARQRFERVEQFDPTSIDEDDVHQLLFDAFRERLVPPSLATGVFILLRLHPAWGLRVAHAKHHEETDVGLEPGWRDETLFPNEIADVVNVAIDDTLDNIVATLEESPEGKFSEFGKQLEELFTDHVDTLEHELEDIDTEHTLPVLLDHTHSRFTSHEFAVELFESWLVPAGIGQIDYRNRSYKTNLS